MSGLDPNISYHSPLKPSTVGNFHTNVGLLLTVVPFRGPLSATAFQKSFIEGWRDFASVWKGASVKVRNEDAKRASIQMMRVRWDNPRASHNWGGGRSSGQLTELLSSKGYVDKLA